MWVKQCHKPPKLGIVYSTVIKMVMTGGWFIIVLTTLYIHIYIYICMLVGGLEHEFHDFPYVVYYCFTHITGDDY